MTFMCLANVTKCNFRVYLVHKCKLSHPIIVLNIYK